MGGYLNHRNMTWWADEKDCSIHVSRLRVHLLAHGPRSWRTRPPSSSSSTSCGVGNVGGTASYLVGSCKRADLMFVVATIDIKMLMQFNSCIMDRYHAHFLEACLCLLWEIRGDSSTNFVQKWIASLFDLVLSSLKMGSTWRSACFFCWGSSEIPTIWAEVATAEKSLAQNLVGRYTS